MTSLGRIIGLVHVFLLATVASEKLEFEGRKIVLIGGTQGMAMEAGKIIIARGGKVVFSSRSQNKVDGILQDLGQPETAFGLTCDAGKVEDIAKLLERANHSMGGIDGVVYGPTCMEAKYYSSFETLAEVGETIQAHRCQQLYNVENFLETVRLAIPYMKNQKDSAIVVISSSIGQVPTLGATYAAAKATADYYVRSLSLFLPKYKIRINSFAAGPHATSIFGVFGDEAAKAILKDLAWRTSIGRVGTSEEGGEVLAFMLSSRSSFMNGAILTSDGGANNMMVFSDALLPPEFRLVEPSPQRLKSLDSLSESAVKEEL